MRKLILTLFIILYGFGQMMAQRFPITVVPQVNPPAPVNFYNYADQTTINSPLRVQLLLSDITISNEQIRLKVYFEGNGIAFESRDVVIGASSLFIDGGVPLVLTNTVLAPYFEFQNIKGINSNIYGSTIPEGSYQFCFEVFDFSTGNRLSSKTCASAFIYNNEPPLLNLPFKGTNIEPTEVENIVFQWTPRHINVSNIKYELSIVEIWDDQVDPQTAFLSQPPVFETTTTSTSFVYGPAQPQLLPEKRYAWRVKAKALQGIEEIGLFKNEGNSEIFWFSKTSPCSTLDNVSATPKGISKINVFWGEDPSEYSEYTIAYREANRPNAYWFTKRTNSGWTTIWDLKPGTTYEYKVKAKCKYQYGEYSDVQEVTTDTTQDETANYDCGITPDPIAIANQVGHPGLKIGDRITAGDFIVRIVEIDNQADGRITGRGYVGIPYLRSTHYGVKFDNILINTENQLAAGEIVTLYDPVYGESETMTVDINTDVVEIITGDEGETSQVEVGFVIESITVDENGAVIITGANGEEALVPGGRDLQISGSDGKVWKVEENGTVRALDGVMAEDGPATDDNTEGVEDNEIMQISETGVLITFIESGYYNFDALPDSAKDKLDTEEFYPSIPVVGGGTYTPAFKAISNISGNDFVKAVADFSDDSITNEDIVFKTKSGVEIPASWDQNVATLTLKKSYDYAITKVLATVKKGKGEKSTIAGVLNVVHLGSKAFTDVNIVLIPVNKAKVNRVEAEIKKIYSKVGVNLNITVGQRFQVPENIWDKEEPYGVLNAGDSGLLSHYSAEEAAINAYFKTTSEYRQDAYYVFVTDLKGVNSNENREIEGFMPLKSQFGYIFQSATDDARTIAHELGHGVFGLEHPFAEYGTEEATTHFMMDYKGGTAFNHMDWKNIFAPGFKLYWFQGDEDGESNVPNRKLLLQPDGRLFVAEGLTYIRPDKVTQINGAIYKIRNGGIEYTWNEDKRSYFNEETILSGIALQPEVNGKVLVNPGDKLYLYWYGLSCDQDVIYKTTWGFYNKNKEGFRIRDVIKEDAVTYVKPLGCPDDFVPDSNNYTDNCQGSDVAELNKQGRDFALKLGAILTKIQENKPIDKTEIVEALEGKWLCLVKGLHYEEHQERFLKILIEGEDYDSNVEETIVKLINSIKVENLNKFYTNVLMIKDNQRTVLDKLLVELENYTIQFLNDDNYDYFLDILPTIASQLNTDTKKWNIINSIINRGKKRDRKLNNDINISDIEKKAITKILMFLKDNQKYGEKMPMIAAFFNEMFISQHCSDIEDYKIVFNIAAKRSENREAFANYTRIERRQEYKESVLFKEVETIGTSWVLPPHKITMKSATGDYPIDMPYYWAKYNTEYETIGARAFLEKFITRYDTYLSDYKSDNSFWNTVSEKPEEISDVKLKQILSYINNKENKKSLRSVSVSKKLAVITRIIEEDPDAGDIDPVFKGIENDALVKLALSCQPIALVKHLEQIGYNNIYRKLSGDRLSKFLMLAGEAVVKAKKQIKLKPSEVEKYLEKPSSIPLKLEADMLETDLLSVEFANRVSIKINEQPAIPYNQMVLVYVSGSFKFLGHQFKKGDVLNIPAIQAFAISRQIDKELTKESAWLALDVLSFAVGIGELKLAFKVGGMITKATIVADVTSSGLGAIATLLNEDDISPALRSDLQMFSMVVGSWNELKGNPVTGHFINRLDNKLGARPIKTSAADKLREVMKKYSIPNSVTDIIEKIKDIRKANPNDKLLKEDLIILTSELWSGNPPNVTKLFEKHVAQAFDGWQVLRRADPNAVRTVELIEEVVMEIYGKGKKAVDLTNKIKSAGSFNNYKITEGMIIYNKLEYNKFIAKVTDFKKGDKTKLAVKAYILWGKNTQESWDELKKLFEDNNIKSFTDVPPRPNK
ncbi:hypothetical protein ATO12_25140 [Aquimarina atlantica]|uniref:Fibronectin type-III domain-containing protein n=1 Tax=Aquimarina atlantica TaxID=1317122 RepID=A0A023BQ82_9FLAO|nr:fibronectin type III domain-containing protein [Aquimarina atlantica]EZH72222.1 hypothetical protein ATO12_25140 [Aquimarina atlantica]